MCLHICLPAFVDNLHGKQWFFASGGLVVVHYTRKTHQYTRIHAFQDVHGSWEPGCDKYGVNGTCCRYHAGPIVMIDVGLAQAFPNNSSDSTWLFGVVNINRPFRYKRKNA